MHDILKRKYFLKDLKGENEAKKIFQKQAPQWTVLSSGSVTQTMTELLLCFWDADNPNTGLPVLAENSPNTYPNPKNTRSEALRVLRSHKTSWKTQHIPPYPEGFLCYYRLHLRMVTTPPIFYWKRTKGKGFIFKTPVSKSWICLWTELILWSELFWSTITMLTFYLIVTSHTHTHKQARHTYTHTHTHKPE